MNKEALYGHLPRILLRLFCLGLPAAVVFLFLWYQGGYNYWGHFLDVFMWPFKSIFDISFTPGHTGTSTFALRVVLENGTVAFPNFPINRNLNHSLVQIVTLLAAWPHQNLRAFLRLLLFCLVFTVAYHLFTIILQLYYTQIGEKMATDFQLFWEDSFWHSIVKKLASFDKLILRYWTGFPIFGCALAADYFFGKRKKSKGKKQKSAGRNK